MRVSFCGNYIFSGHTMTVIMAYLTIKECKLVILQTFLIGTDTRHAVRDFSAKFSIRYVVQLINVYPCFRETIFAFIVVGKITFPQVSPRSDKKDFF